MTGTTYKLSPSDFAYLWEECKFCYVQKVKYGVSYSGPFPAMFGKINTLLQNSIMGLNLRDIIPGLPSGVISVQEGYLASIVVPGTKCYLKGRFDILSLLEDGTYALIDFKITSPDDGKILKKYATQLHAYKFALENPQMGTPLKISQMGVVSINPDSMKLEGGKVIFTTTPTWHPIEEDMDGFYALIKDISQVLSESDPASAPTCTLCIYRGKFGPRLPVTDEIPF